MCKILRSPLWNCHGDDLNACSTGRWDGRGSPKLDEYWKIYSCPQGLLSTQGSIFLLPIHTATLVLQTNYNIIRNTEPKHGSNRPTDRQIYPRHYANKLTLLSSLTASVYFRVHYWRHRSQCCNILLRISYWCYTIFHCHDYNANI